VPDDPIEMDEGEEVSLTLSGSGVIQPEITDPGERRRRLQVLVEDMANHPWPDGAPRLTREDLHERR
jgi:hypothetical protein